MHMLNFKKKPVNIHPTVTIGKRVSFGKFTYVNAHSLIGHDVQIGSFCSIARFVEIAPHIHPLNLLSTHTFQYQKNKFEDYPMYKHNNFIEIKHLDRPTVIENDVWIGAKAIIMKGVKIETGAVVGAGSIVTKDVPPYAIVVGNPAKIIKYRFDESLVSQLLDSKWWENDLSLLQNLPYDNISKCLEKIISRKESNPQL